MYASLDKWIVKINQDIIKNASMSMSDSSEYNLMLEIYWEGYLKAIDKKAYNDS